MSARRIVITGASSGIGAATAIAFAREGARLVIAARGQAGLDDVARRCAQAGGEAHAVQLDVTDLPSIEAFAARARDLLGGIDLWFSCVGVGVVGRYEAVPMAEHARVIEANLLAHMAEAHAALPIFVAQEHGTWVNMISAGGYLATPHAAAYAASKFGLRGFSAALRGEMSKHPRIHVCDVYPTFVDTPGVDHAGNHSGARLTLPPGALAPETVAKAVVRLARRPRDTTAVGAPAIAFKLAAFVMPNLGAAVMNGFMDVWEGRAPPDADTAGTLFEPPAGPSGVEGGRRRPERRRAAAIGVATIGAAGAAAVGVWLWRRRG